MDPGIPGLTKGVYVVGEALLDVTVSPDGVEQRRPGGSPMNVAFGLARLGVSARLLSVVGDDDGGRQVVEHLRSAGVKLDDLQVVPGSHTSVARATIDREGAATYSFNLSWDIPDAAVPRDFGVLHAGSIAAVLEPGADRVADLFVSAPPEVIRSFDPNIRPSITPDRDRVLRRVDRLAACADLIKMSDEDAAWLFPGYSEEECARWALDHGVMLFVLTQGARGCAVWTPSQRLARPAHTPSRVVDTIGAGDAFMAGLLAALSRWGLLDLLRRGEISPGDLRRLAGIASRAASLTVAQVGAQPPTWSQVRAAS